jgi:hypothetical protein
MPIFESVGRGLLVSFALIMLCVAAEAQFSAPFPVANEGMGEPTPRVAIDPQGNAIIVWRQFY